MAKDSAWAKGRDLVWTGFYSVLVWLTLSAWAWSLFPAFGIKLDFMAGVLLQVVIALAILVPTAPAFIGAFHLAAAATLAFWGWTRARRALSPWCCGWCTWW